MARMVDDGGRRARWACALATVVALACATEASAQLLLPEVRVSVAGVTAVNSAGADYSPTWYPGGVVYVSTRDGDLRRRLRPPRGRRAPLMDLYFAPETADAAVLGTPEPFSAALGRGLNAGPITFSADGERAYVTRNAARARRRAGRAAARLQLYELVRGREGTWGAPRPVAFADATANDAHPALTADGSALVFVSDREGGFGGLDLWVVERAGDGWGRPRNLGEAVNTPGNEGFPFVHPDGTLYYATTVTDEDAGNQHLDIAYTRQRDGNWDAPTFLGAPFNTGADDFGLIVDAANASGYFSSSRAGGFGADDIYRFEIVGAGETPPRGPLTVAVTDASTGRPLQGASVTYLNADTTSLAEALDGGVVGMDGEPLRLAGAERYMTDIDGRGTISLPPGRYLVEVNREGYEPTQTTVELSADGTSLPAALTPRVPCGNVRVSVLSAGTVRPVAGATVSVQRVLGGGDVMDASTGAGGEAEVCVPCGGVYEVTAASSGASSRATPLDTRGEDCGGGRATTVTLYLETARRGGDRPGDARAADLREESGTPLAPGTQFQMPSVFYASSDWRLSEAARGELDDLARLMRRFPEMRVALGSHTDATGPAAFNRALSQRRADEARRYLMTAGDIAPERVVAVGYGESRVRNGCRDGVACSPAQHRENRRTEVTILGEGTSVTYPPPLAQDSPPASPPSGRPNAVERQRVAPAEREDGASYLVIASTHADAAAAARAATQIRELGYGDVEVRTLPGASGPSVIAGRFGTMTEASQFARALREAHGISGAAVRRVR